MSGFNQTQDQVNNKALLDQALKDYFANPVLQLLDTQRQLAENLRNLGKPQSVFDAGNIYKNIGNYLVIETSPTAAKMKAFEGSVLPTVYVFPLNGAEVLRFCLEYSSTAGNIVPFMACFALSTQDTATNPIPLDQFSQFRKGNPANGTANLIVGGSQVYDDIPCSGYKFIHIFSFGIGNPDLLARCALTAGVNSTIWMTYSLLK
jgi:hypothetical protein